MNKVQVLIEGYAKPLENGGWVASGTTTLITTDPSTALRASSLRIITDPGTNRQLLLSKLAEQNLKPEDINVVFMTHYHPDHNLLVGIFEKATVYDDGMYYRGDEQGDHDGTIPETDIKVIKTPGHEQFHGSLLVPTEDGVVVVAGDVFWWDSTETQKTDKTSLLEHSDPFVKDESALLESRKKVLEVADWIIPGHGKMFENKSKGKN